MIISSGHFTSCKFHDYLLHIIKLFYYKTYVNVERLSLTNVLCSRFIRQVLMKDSQKSDTMTIAQVLKQINQIKENLF